MRVWVAIHTQYSCVLLEKTLPSFTLCVTERADCERAFAVSPQSNTTVIVVEECAIIREPISECTQHITKFHCVLTAYEGCPVCRDGYIVKGNVTRGQW